MLSVIIPVLGFVVLKFGLGSQAWIDVPIHSLIESIGLFAGLFAAVFLLSSRAKQETPSVLVWIALALIGMGILDGFHAAEMPGNVFVWLHSMAVLTGGLLFTGIWWGERIGERTSRYLIVGGIILYAIILGTVSINVPGIIPLMVENNVFTPAANVINVAGGVFFIIAAAGLLFRQGREESGEFTLFAAFCLLNGLSGLLFPFTEAWAATWWFWHILRVSAYILLLIFIYNSFVLTQQATQQYSRSLIEANLDPLVTISPEGKITDVNDASVKATGISRDRLIGSDFSDYFTEPEKAQAGYRKVLAEGFVRDYPLTLRSGSGATMDVLYNASVYRNIQGDVQGVFAAARDITERKRMEGYTRSLIEANLDPLVTISPEGKITDVNDASVKATGISRDRLIGSDFSDYFTEPEKAKAGYKKVLSEGFVRDYPLTLRSGSGATMDVLYNASVYRNIQGEVQGVFAAARDITERKRMEGYARSLIEANLDPLVTISPEGKITDVNDATVRATGISRDRLIGSDFSDYFTEPEKAQAGYRKVLTEGYVRDYPLTLRSGSGATIDVLYNASVYRDSRGEVQGVFAAARDITERKRMEEELKRYRDQLEEMVKARTAALTRVLGEVQETINVLATSSSQILSTTTEIAAGAVETASAISQTTTTVEEVKQTADLASQKAKNVAEGSLQASATAQAGQKAVGDVVEGMHRVQEQMESIADNVVQLAEKSQAIGEIIVTVNDIAEQSNLLAVNASIEAAKAGEQGKGFGVVAQEIRTLAEQSKEATSQVRVILTDIQRGVSSAVMATEQGNRTVTESMKQSTEAGEAIRVLTGSVGEAAKAATQIAASSQQQVVGINQIVQSMENIRQASQQNLEGTRQAEETAKALHDLGQKLKGIAESVRL